MPEQTRDFTVAPGGIDVQPVAAGDVHPLRIQVPVMEVLTGAPVALFDALNGAVLFFFGSKKR